MHWRIWFLFLLHRLLFSSSHRILLVPAHNAISHARSMYLVGEALSRAGNDVFLLQLIADSRYEVHSPVGVVDRIIHAHPNVNTTKLDTARMATRMTWSSRPRQSTTMLTAWTYKTGTCISILSHNSTRHELSSLWKEHWDAVIIDDITPCAMTALKDELINRSIVIIDFKLVITPSLQPRDSLVPIWPVHTYDPGRFLYRLGTTLQAIHYGAVMKYVDFMVTWTHSELKKFRTSLVSKHRTLAVSVVPTGFDVVQARTLDSAEFDIDCPIGEAVPEPFKTFVEDPQSEGTILFAMGHYANWNEAPPGALDSFIRAFSHLHQYRIIWQFSADFELKNLTSNVMTGSWIPQTAILNHRKTKLFISHMGVKSAREAVCARRPVLALPMFADQYRNSLLAQYHGYAVYLDKRKLSPDTVYQSIMKILNEPKYYTAVQRLQDQLNDTIRTPGSLFAFDVDFFIRRNKHGILKQYIKPKRSMGIKNFLENALFGAVSLVLCLTAFIMVF